MKENTLSHKLSNDGINHLKDVALALQLKVSTQFINDNLQKICDIFPSDAWEDDVLDNDNSDSTITILQHFVVECNNETLYEILPSMYFADSLATLLTGKGWPINESKKEMDQFYNELELVCGTIPGIKFIKPNDK